MRGIEPFDLLNSPLEGTNLIEASAGTGKTYTLTGLFLRLILERNLSVNEILLVTFTEAATGELKERIRGKLREAISAFSTNQSEDALLKGLLKKIHDATWARRILGEALRTFDQAAIFTIHGFCRRILYENAFESGSLFDTELVIDVEYLKSEIVEDFWRKHFYKASPLFVRYAINNRVNPGAFLSLLTNWTTQPYLKIIPQLEMPDSSQQEEAFKAAFTALSHAWTSVKTEIEEILTGHPGLNRNRYKKSNIPFWIECMDQYMTSGEHDPFLFKGFEKFTVSELERSTKKGHLPPSHPFFEKCEVLKQRQEELEKIFEQRLLSLKVQLFQYGQGELARRKAAKNIHSFDDLLLKVYQALEGKGGGILSDAIRRKFRAALIDEFQDTDPLQYAIFNKIFNHGDSTLFLVGDPKQAIYGFRGADIFAYLQAARDVSSRYTLRENWRSEPHLITAINTIFAHADRPFVYDEIPFQPPWPASERDPERLCLTGPFETPLEIWFLDATPFTENGRAMTKTQARELIPRAVSGEISRLLNLGKDHKALLGKRPLRPGDIAVLVRRHTEARLMQEALCARHIPSVLYSTANLFDSHEALEMLRVLAAITEPNNEKTIKAALTTDMIGLKGEELNDLLEDETGWERWLVRFKEYHDLWKERGFIRMFRYLIRQENILVRLMSFPDGERRCTNLLHLSEVLHQQSVKKRLGISELLKWLSEQRDPSTPRLDEHQLRLESDENAVKLVTIHKSKGLEYPVVFCPFGWDGSMIKRSKAPFAFHDEGDNMRLTLDLGSERLEKNRALAENEQLAENLRLLYVALTRAKNRCYLVWGRFNEAETSAQTYLFHQPEAPLEQENLLSTISQRFRALSDEDLFAELKRLQEKGHGTIRVLEMPLDQFDAYSPSQPQPVSLSCRTFAGDIDRQWRLSSFSSLVSGKPHRVELAERDETGLHDEYDQQEPEEPGMEEGLSGIFAFPKGTKAGIFLHDLMEHLDFTQKDSAIRELVSDKLREYGFELRWENTVFETIRRLLSIPLEPDRNAFRLSRLSNQDRRNELEFYFPLRTLSPKKFKQVFARFADPELSEDFPQRIERLDFSPTRGFMKGFIDMVFQFQGRFYLVDWKSNFLGNKIEDYGQEALAEVMKNQYYILQYHLYSVALNQYLQLRLPGYSYETHFGGVYYIFLRGVDPDRGLDFGIYRDRPSGDLIRELCIHLIEKGPH